MSGIENGTGAHGGPTEAEASAQSAIRAHYPVLQYFGWDHLPPHLQVVSKPFGDLAKALEQTLPDGPEKSVAFRKLLESKDAAVRAALV